MPHSLGAGKRAQWQVQNAPVIEADESWNERRLLSVMENHTQKAVHCDLYTGGAEYPSNMATLHTALMMGTRRLLQHDAVPKIVKALNMTCQGQCSIPKGKATSQTLTTEEKIKRDILCDDYFRDVKFTRYISLTSILVEGEQTVLEVPTREKLCSCQLYAYADKLRNDGIDQLGNSPKGDMDLSFWGRLLVSLFPPCYLGWVGVGEVRNANHDKLEPTDVASDNCDEVEAANSRTLKEALLLTAVGKRAISNGRADWRSLGLRVALYDDLRERRITNPSGVSWSFPKHGNISRDLVFSYQFRDEWDYYATAISMSGLQHALKSKDGFKVVYWPTDGTYYGSLKEKWDLRSEDVLVIFLNANGTQGYCGLETWLLSHLSYPLVNVLEDFRMAQFQKDGTIGYFNSFTFRNSGLVDLNKTCRKIVFCTTNADSTFTIGGTTFTIPQVGVDPLRKEFDDSLKHIITKCLDSRMSLKEYFINYCFDYFTGDLNWLEIDQMVAYLTTRWHNQPECTVQEGVRVLHWLPRGHGDFYATAGLPQQDIYCRSDFGQRAACLGFDHATVPLECARSYPVLSIGTWSFEAEIAVVLGISKYVTTCTESATRIEERLRAGGWDRLLRASYQRSGFEEWKRAAGIRDEILAPNNEAYKGLENMWNTLTESGSEGMCAASIANMLCTHGVKWHWSVNKFNNSISYTGIRGCVDWMKNNYSASWGTTDMKIYTDSQYVLVNNTGHWANLFWTQVSEGQRTEFLDQILMRLDVNSWYDKIKYKSWPSGIEAKQFSYRVETRKTAKLTKEIGWNIGVPATDEQVNGAGWGWGLRSHVKLWNNGGYATIAIHKDAAEACCRTNFSEGTWLARGPVAPAIDPQSMYLYKPMGWNITAEDYRRR